MESGAGGSREDGPTSSGSVRGLAEATLLRALERLSEVNDEGMRPAVHAFVDALLQEGVAPEAVVIRGVVSPKSCTFSMRRPRSMPLTTLPH